VSDSNDRGENEHCLSEFVCLCHSMLACRREATRRMSAAVKAVADVATNTDVLYRLHAASKLSSSDGVPRSQIKLHEPSDAPPLPASPRPTPRSSLAFTTSIDELKREPSSPNTPRRSPYFEVTDKLLRKNTAPPLLITALTQDNVINKPVEQVVAAVAREPTPRLTTTVATVTTTAQPQAIKRQSSEDDPEGSDVTSEASTSVTKRVSAAADELERLAAMPIDITECEVEVASPRRRTPVLSDFPKAASYSSRSTWAPANPHQSVATKALMEMALYESNTVATANAASVAQSPRNTGRPLALGRSMSTLHVSGAVTAQSSMFVRDLAREHETATLFEQLRALNEERYAAIMEHMNIAHNVHLQIIAMAEADERDMERNALQYPRQPPTPRDPAADQFDHRKLFAKNRESDAFMVFNDVLAKSAKAVRDCEEMFKANKLVTRMRARMLPSTSTDELTELLRITRRHRNFEAEVLRIQGLLGPRCVEYEKVVSGRLLPRTTHMNVGGDSFVTTPRSSARERDCKEALRECIVHMAPYAVLDASITTLKEFVEVGVIGNRAFLDMGRDVLRLFVIREQLRGSRTFNRRGDIVSELPAVGVVSYQAASNMFGLVLTHCGDWLEDFFSDGDHERLIPLFWCLSDVENNVKCDSLVYVQTVLKLRSDAPLTLLGILAYIGAQHLVEQVQRSIYEFALTALDRKFRRNSSGGASSGGEESSSSSSSVATPSEERKKKHRSLHRRKHDKK